MVMNDHNHIDFLSIFQVEQKKAINNLRSNSMEQKNQMKTILQSFISSGILLRVRVWIRVEAKRMSPFLDGWDYWDTPCTCSSQVWNLQEEAKRIDALPDLDRNKRRCTIHNVVMDGEDWRRQLATFTAR